MNFNLVTNLETCRNFIAQNELFLNFAYYSHVPTAVVSLIFGIYVFIKNRHSLVGRLFLAVSFLFILWSFLDLVIWLSADSRRTMFVWSIINLVENLVTGVTLYFTYVFLEKKDAALKYKVIFSFLLLLFAVFIPTRLNLTGFNSQTCESEQGILIAYFYFIEAFFFVWMLGYLIKKIVKSKGEQRKITVNFSIGVICFLLSFSGTNILASITENWNILQYGLFGMPVFAGFLTYLIVKYKAFDIKLFGFQALVIALIILIGSQFFFIQNNTNKILNSITFILSAIFGYYLVRSVKIEIERKEQLQHMTNELTDANDKLRKMDNTKSEFISIASHQLRTPLTAIKGFGSLLLEGFYGELDSKQHDAVNKIYQSNTRLINLVEDLLDVSRIESGRMEFKFEKTKLEIICREIYETFIIRAKEHRLSLKMDIPKEPLPEVTIDGEKIKEVISNLIDNAIKYTPKGGVKLALSQRDNFVRLTVSDTGIGIPPDEIPYLFAKFSRGKDISRLNTTGTGLGLYVGKSIVEANHGKIWIESEGAGKGSKFVVELPVG